MAITRKNTIVALKKDLALLKKQYYYFNKIVEVKADQFLNVGNDQWCGGRKEVLNLYKYVINFTNRMIKNLNSMSDEKFYPEYVDAHWGTPDFASESRVFLFDSPSKIEGTHHSLFPNWLKLMGYSGRVWGS